MQTQINAFLCFNRVNTKLFSAVPTISRISSVGHQYGYQCELMNFFQHKRLQRFEQNHYQNLYLLASSTVIT